jgi:hypothetical protein
MDIVPSKLCRFGLKEIKSLLVILTPSTNGEFVFPLSDELALTKIFFSPFFLSLFYFPSSHFFLTNDGRLIIMAPCCFKTKQKNKEEMQILI